LDPDLELATTLPGSEQIVVPVSAHVLRRPMILFARSADILGTAEGGGRAIADLFGGDRLKVAWAWVAMWQRAVAGLTAQRIVLSSDVKEREQNERLSKLKTQADNRQELQRGASGGEGGNTDETGATTASVQVRQLKDLSKLRPTMGSIVNRGTGRGGIIVLP